MNGRFGKNMGKKRVGWGFLGGWKLGSHGWILGAGRDGRRRFVNLVGTHHGFVLVVIKIIYIRHYPEAAPCPSSPPSQSLNSYHIRPSS